MEQPPFASVELDKTPGTFDVHSIKLETENGTFHVEAVEGGGIRIVGIDNRLNLAVLPHSDNTVSIVPRDRPTLREEMQRQQDIADKLGKVK